MNKLVSIIIPVYKTPRELFLACVESVLAWRNELLEVILVIDSPGHEIEKDVYEVAARDSRVKVIRNAVNQGPSYSRNRGIDIARGGYLMMVDADDQIIPSVCEKALSECIDKNLDFCAVARVYPWQQDGVDCKESDELFIGSFKESGALCDVLKRLDMSSSGVWYKRDFLIKNNLRYPENLRQNEDFVFTTSILSKGGVAAVWNRYGYRITVHADSLSHNTKASSFYLHQLFAAKRISELIEPFRLSNTALRFYAEHGYNQLFASWHKAKFKSAETRRVAISEFKTTSEKYLTAYSLVLSLSAKTIIRLVIVIPGLLFSRKPMANYVFRLIRKIGWYYV